VNPFEPWGRAMVRQDFEAATVRRSARVVANVGRGALALAELSVLVRRHGYDLLYCNGTTADFAGAAAAAVSRVPALWHVRYTEVPGALRGLHAKLAASPSVARILCVSRAASALFPHVGPKVRVVHNAVDAAELAPGRAEPRLRRELGLGPDCVVFGSHGRVLRRKGFVELIQAARIVVDSTRGRELAFVIVGDTPEDFEVDHLAECRALSRSLGLSDYVHFVGFQPAIAPYVGDFDVSVVPSVYADPLPRAVMESMALAKPVVAFDVGGVAEMLVHGVTGTLVRRGDPPDVRGLADALLSYLRDPELRRRHGAEGRARVLAGFDGVSHGKTIHEEIVRAANRAPRRALSGRSR
jgi:glycosyltransferase involved in cell wall biosynthesis